MIFLSLFAFLSSLLTPSLPTDSMIDHLTVRDTVAVEVEALPIVSEKELMAYKRKQLRAFARKDAGLLRWLHSYDVDEQRIRPREATLAQVSDLYDLNNMNPVFMPLVFRTPKDRYRLSRFEWSYTPDLTTKWAERAFPSSPYSSIASSERLGTSLSDSLMGRFRAEKFVFEYNQQVLEQIQVEQIELVQFFQHLLPEPERLVFPLNGKQRPDNWLHYSLQLPERPKPVELPRTPYKPWARRGNTRLQFSQTYISPNWSKGGESNMAGLASIYLEANYNDRKRTQFDNNIEIKVGLNTVSTDSLRNLNVSTDQIRATSKLGLRMYNNWYYSLSSEFLTQMLNNYKKNTMSLRSSLLSPAKLYVGLGVDFKKKGKKNQYDLSVILSPLTYKMNYLLDIENYKSTSYGIDAGKHMGHELGSKISANLSWRFNEYVHWKSKFNYYTDFTYLDSELENTLNFRLSGNFTAQIFLHLKLDDRMKRDPGEVLLQAQELMSFGMAYFW